MVTVIPNRSKSVEKLVPPVQSLLEGRIGRIGRFLPDEFGKSGDVECNDHCLVHSLVAHLTQRATGGGCPSAAGRSGGHIISNHSITGGIHGSGSIRDRTAIGR